MSDNSTLTMEKFIASIEAAKKAIEKSRTIYYGAVSWQERGKAMRCAATEFNPEFFVIHPDDFEQFRAIAESAGAIVVNIKDEPKEDQIERIRKQFPLLPPADAWSFTQQELATGTIAEEQEKA